MSTTMTTTSPVPDRAATASTATVLRRAVASEWTRAWSIRSTWWSLGAAAVLMVGLGVAFGLDPGDGYGAAGAPIWIPGEVAAQPAQFALLAIAMLAMTSEYATGSIRTTLQWVPRRGLLLAARTLVVVGIVTVLGMLLTLATDMTAWAILRDGAHVDVGDVARSVGFVGVVLAAAALLAVGLGAALRSSAGTMTTLFLLLAVLPALLPSFGVPWLTRVGHVLPGSAALSLLGMVEPVLSRAGAWLVLGGWTAGVGTVGAWSLLRRDAA